MSRDFIIKGDICWSRDKSTLLSFSDHYLICTDGISQGVFEKIPDKYTGLKVIDYSGMLVIPGLCDLHLHASQYAFRALYTDTELLSWLNNHAFPEEGRFKDLEYAKKAYEIFAGDIRAGATTRACVFSTIHAGATEILMDCLEKTGMIAYVGKVNMDRNSPDYLTEESAARAASDTEKWITRCEGRCERIKPILTPRFIPACSDELMKLLKEIQVKHDLPVQSHLSENRNEIEWVQELCPDAEFYADAYDRFGLFGGGVKTVMAHCVGSDDREIERIRERGVFIAHCPQSNENLASGIAPVRTFLDKGVKTGLGSDIAGGAHESIFRAMTDAIQVSKLRWRLIDEGLKPLSFEEAFYLGTKGGGEFFGFAGGFDEGFEFDAVVIDDSGLRHPQKLTCRERLERAVYLSGNENIAHKFVFGSMLF
ncbi:MAG: amidohydrolase family protein [Bacillota bacterium]|nr:amidohydrolase family protein [Bacillota bacterium]